MEQKQEILTEEELNSEKGNSRVVKNAQKEEVVKKKKRKKARVRLIPLWIRVIIVLALVVGFFFIGAMIGYGVIGNGEPKDVFQKETWTHIHDVMFEGTPKEKDF